MHGTNLLILTPKAVASDDENSRIAMMKFTDHDDEINLKLSNSQNEIRRLK